MTTTRTTRLAELEQLLRYIRASAEAAVQRRQHLRAYQLRLLIREVEIEIRHLSGAGPEAA